MPEPLRIIHQSSTLVRNVRHILRQIPNTQLHICTLTISVTVHLDMASLLQQESMSVMTH